MQLSAFPLALSPLSSESSMCVCSCKRSLHFDNPGVHWLTESTLASRWNLPAEILHILIVLMGRWWWSFRVRLQSQWRNVSIIYWPTPDHSVFMTRQRPSYMLTCIYSNSPTTSFLSDTISSLAVHSHTVCPCRAAINISHLETDKIEWNPTTLTWLTLILMISLCLYRYTHTHTHTHSQ